MFYALRKDDVEGVMKYLMLDTKTESFFNIDESIMIKMLHKFEIYNIINEGTPRIKREVPVDGKIIIGKLSNKVYRVVSQYTSIQTVTEKEVFLAITNREIVNAKIENGNIIAYEAEEIKTYKENKEFVDYIDAEYSKYIQKSKLLGIDNRFEYLIENEDVRLCYHYGESDRLILPNFITSINTRALTGSSIKQLILNEGLKHIGDNIASVRNKIESVHIPESVQFIGENKNLRFNTNKENDFLCIASKEINYI